MPRRLTLRREILAELGTDDLRLVNAAALPSGVACYTGITWCVAVCDAISRYKDAVLTAINVTPKCPDTV